MVTFQPPSPPDETPSQHRLLMPEMGQYIPPTGCHILQDNMNAFRTESRRSAHNRDIGIYITVGD